MATAFERAAEAPRLAPPPLLDGLLAGLTPEQTQAVCHGPGVLLIVAGPGAGKTKTLIHRIAFLLAQGLAEPHEILAVTFSVRAASELRLRLAELLGEQTAAQVRAATFHSTCARLLRDHAQLFGRSANWTVYDQVEVRKVVDWLLSDRQRTAIQQALTDFGQPASSEVLHEISLAKNRLLTPESYEQDAQHPAGPLIAAVWRETEAELRRSNAMDFDDLLVCAVKLLAEHPHHLELYRRRWPWILVDEYQDTCQAQAVLVSLLATADGNLAVVADDDQCVAKGTAISMADGTERPVETIQPGERVLSSYGRGDLRPARVTSVRRSEQEKGVRVRLESGRSVTSSSDHTHFAGFLASHAKGRFFTYVMWRRDKGFRVGLAARAYSIGRDDTRFGPAHRGLLERADAVWVVSGHDREVEARLAEGTLAARYGLPTIPFVAVAGSDPDAGLVSSQPHIDRLFAACDTEPRGHRLLNEETLAFDLPHYQPQARTMLARHGETRYVVNVGLCTDRRGPTPLHRLAVQGSDEAGRRVVEDLGLPVRSVRGGTSRWLFETQRRNYGEVLALAEMIASRLRCVLRQVAAVGDPGVPGRQTVSLPFVPAKHVRPGMVMATEDGALERVERVDGVRLDTSVFDLNVEGTHNFMANGIVTHNCIYGFRGADAGGLARLAERFPNHKRIVLARNFRSHAEILSAAARSIQHNPDRVPKTLIAMRGPGGQAEAIAFGSEREEASWIAAAVAQELQAGTPPTGILLLARTGYANGPVQTALAATGIPHRVLGSLGLYERSEVRDALSYLTLIVNPADAQAFRRAVGAPRRGVGERTAGQVVALAREAHDGDLIAASASATLSEIGTAKAREQLERFGRGLARARSELAAGRSLGHVTITTVMLPGGLVAHYQALVDQAADGGVRRDAERVLEDLRSLCRAVQAYEERHDPPTLGGFLEHARGLHARELSPGEEDRRITLSTIHRSKGTEAALVVLAGCEERLLPSWRALEVPEQLQEERRLFYVACTRAKDRLYATHAAMRGGRQTGGPSRFLGEAGLL